MKKLFDIHDRLTLYAAVLLIIGLLLRYCVGRRRFNRRGFAGLQYFKTYNAALLTVFTERTINVIAALMIAASLYIVGDQLNV